MRSACRPKTAAASALLALLAGSPVMAQPAQAALAGPKATAAPRVANPADPWEGYNRAVFSFNDALDRALVRPVAQAYQSVLPSPVRAAVDNVFGNLYDGWSMVNHVLQGKPRPAVESGMRVAINSVLGLGGLIDLAGEVGIERHSEDFGQTLGRWGVGPGPYLVLPVLGASTLRDTVALPVDRRANPLAWVDHEGQRWALTGLQVVSTRAGLLGATRMLEQVALDKYTFVRDAHLARRRNDVYDGNPPEEPDAPR